jgi:hypothetical protein
MTDAMTTPMSDELIRRLRTPHRRAARMIVFAFLAARFDHARIDIELDNKPANFEDFDRGWATVSGVEVPFRIVIRPDALRGLRLVGFAFVRSAKQLSPAQRLGLSLIADSRMARPTA